jgi:hypothetical protein
MVSFHIVRRLLCPVEARTSRQNASDASSYTDLGSGSGVKGRRSSEMVVAVEDM